MPQASRGREGIRGKRLNGEMILPAHPISSSNPSLPALASCREAPDRFQSMGSAVTDGLCMVTLPSAARIPTITNHQPSPTCSSIYLQPTATSQAMRLTDYITGRLVQRTLLPASSVRHVQQKMAGQTRGNFILKG